MTKFQQMEIIKLPGEGFAPPGGSVVTIGAYDGVHLGHRSLIEQTKEKAAEIAASSVVLTFDRHPAEIVRPDSAPKLLTSLEQKLELLAQTGVDYTVVLVFDSIQAEQSAGEFVTEILGNKLNVRAVIVGPDFHFGHGRQGNPELLRKMGIALGFESITASPVLDVEHNEQISSTRIRRLLSDGQVEDAARLLGRAYEVRGTIIHGDGRGRELGYPTANFDVSPDIQLPIDGVYAGWYFRPKDQSLHRAAINLGRRPTFYGRAEHPLLEAHLLDFDDDLYEEGASVHFVSRLRDEIKFEMIEDLVEQMGRDVEQTRAMPDAN